MPMVRVSNGGTGITGFRTLTLNGTSETSFTFTNKSCGFIICPSATLTNPKINGSSIAVTKITGIIFVTGEAYYYIGTISAGSTFSGALGGYPAHVLIIEN